MTDLNSYLASLNESSNSLKTLYFRPPGIFTNALITKPEITTLLRDADNHENALYHVDHQGKPERKDGTRGAVDRLNDEFEELEIQQLVEKNVDNYVQDINNSRPAVVPVPREIETPVSENSRGVKNLLSKFTEENQTDYDVDVLCETVKQLLEKYPIKGLNQELERYRSQWEALNSEIMQHEETIEKQRRQLSLLNVSLSDRDLTTGQKTEPTKKVKTAAEVIAEEEEELRQLELEFERKTRETNALLEASKR